MSRIASIFSMLLIYIGIVIAVGFIAGRKVKTDDDFYVGGRQMGFIPTALSMWATILSGGMVLGTMGLYYANGAKMLGYAFGYMILFPIFFWLVGDKMRAISKARGYYTYLQFLRDRYNSKLFGLPAGILSLVFLIGFMAVNAVAVGVILQTYANIPYIYGVILFYVVTGIYVTMGGLKSVMYTDVIQGFIGISFFIIACVALVFKAGGPIAVLSTGNPVELFPVEKTPTLVAWYLSWFVLQGMATVILPDRCLRFISIKNRIELRKAIFLTMLIVGVAITAMFLVGGALRVLMPGIAKTDTVLTLALEEYFPYLVPFLFITVWAAGMSSVDSQTITCAAIIKADILGNLPNKGKGIKTGGKFAKLSVIVMLLLSMIFAGSQPPFLWTLIAMVLSIFLQFLPALVGGLYSKRYNKLGAEIGWTVGSLVTLYYLFFQTPPLTMHAGVVGLIPNIIIYVVGYFASSVENEQYQNQMQEAKTL